MTFASFAFGVVTLSVALAAIGWGAVQLRRALFGALDGTLALLVTTVLGASTLVVVLQIVGAIGVFSRWTVVVALPVVGVLIGVVARRQVRDVRAVPSSSRPRWAAVVAIVLAGVVAAQWVAHTEPALHGGMRDLDTLRYHGPFAARWVQQHDVVHLQYTSPENQEVFFPGNTELLDGYGMLLFGRDLLTPLRNLLWLGVALLAAWCAGKRLGSAPGALAGVAAVCSTPLLSSIEPASAKNDIVALAWLLATAALVVHALPSADRAFDARLFAVGGLAAGLAAGTKLTVLAPLGVLFVGSLVVLGRRALRPGVTFALLALCTGGLWYARNLAYTGTPLPWLHLHLGPITLAGPKMPYNEQFGYTVLHYIGSSHFWSQYVWKGVRRWFGPLFFVLVFGALAAAVAAVVGRRRPGSRVVGVAALVALAAYVVTPWSAGGPKGTPRLFSLDLRFMAPGLVLGALAAARRNLEAVVVGLATVVVVTNQFVSRGRWPASIPFSLLTTLVLAGAVVVAWLAASRRVVAAVALVPFIAVVGLGWVVQREMYRHWYSVDNTDLTAAYRLFHDARDARIAVGGFADDYPLYGVALKNRVQYIGVQLPHGGFRSPATCAEWMTRLRDGHYRYVVTSTSPALEQTPSQEAAWTARDPGARVLLRRGITTVFRLDAPPNLASCAT